MTSKNAAAWIRVSSGDQHEANQVPDIERLCAARGWIIRTWYTLHDASAYTGEHREQLTEMLAAAHRGEFSTVVIWAADRITREGIEELLSIVRRLREARVGLVSVQEPWLSGSDATAELLIAIAGWVARQESARRSERIKAGMARRAAQGLPVGRQAGAKDKAPRRRSGYHARWERERASGG